MSTIEIVTVTISSIAIGAAVVSILLFVLHAMLQRKLIIRAEEDLKVSDGTASVIRLFAGSFKEEVPDDGREVLKAIVLRYSQTSLTSVFDDPTERSYLFEALTDPSKLPWESGGQHGDRVG